MDLNKCQRIYRGNKHMPLPFNKNEFQIDRAVVKQCKKRDRKFFLLGLKKHFRY